MASSINIEILLKLYSMLMDADNFHASRTLGVTQVQMKKLVLLYIFVCVNRTQLNSHFGTRHEIQIEIFTSQ